jgi:hypothetical protein
MGSSLMSSSYSLDIGSGAFIEKLQNDEILIERRIFASQEYTELLLAYVKITRLGVKGLLSNDIHSCIFEFSVHNFR